MKLLGYQGGATCWLSMLDSLHLVTPIAQLICNLSLDLKDFNKLSHLFQVIIGYYSSSEVIEFDL